VQQSSAGVRACVQCRLALRRARRAVPSPSVRRVCRYTLGEVKAELLEAMGLNTEAEGSRMQFLRRGYKTTTWWEDDEEKKQSDAWRT
jgi:hypothetical protein